MKDQYPPDAELGPPTIRPANKAAFASCALLVSVISFCLFWFGRSTPPKDATAEFWNRLFKPSGGPPPAWPSWQKEWPEAIRRIRDSIGTLPTANVDPLAIGTGEKMQSFLSEWANLFDHLNWMNEHPVQSDASVAFGGSAYPKWRIKAEECKRRAAEFNQFAQFAFSQLSAQNRATKLWPPLQLPIGVWDEHVLTATTQEKMISSAFEVGVLIGASLSGS